MIREATSADKPRLIEMSTRFIASAPLYRDLFNAADPQRVEALVDQVLELGVVFVCERVTLMSPGQMLAGTANHPSIGERSRLVGMLGLVGPLPHLLMGTYAEEVGWWVEPEHRNGTIGPRLMHHMECWCRQNRVYMVKMLAPVDTDVGAFYEKCGYRAVETAWVKVFS